ncbi:conserved hypothetical protein [Histoplasma capsulatum var. duboisii H88]|uniref:Uncharacterized protein n=1 Tax=Ajellomyces capsulatus (strain H88) TaxID=544711 RepID=F0UGH3_AJEC8|nr:conserved hypothetical protein [Histoplasma capsulatum var. duboisii H88]
MATLHSPNQGARSDPCGPSPSRRSRALSKQLGCDLQAVSSLQVIGLKSNLNLGNLTIRSSRPSPEAVQKWSVCAALLWVVMPHKTKVLMCLEVTSTLTFDAVQIRLPLFQELKRQSDIS